MAERWTADQIGDLSGRSALVTGANSGIGLRAAEALAGAGAKVLMGCRDPSKAARALSGLLDAHPGADAEVIQLDLADLGAIARTATEVSEMSGPLDLLINNAGILHDDVLGSLDIASLRLQMEVNAFAPLLICEALLPNLHPGSKIANITSRMGSIGDNDSGGRYGYRASKAAFNAFGRSLAIDLKERGIAVAQLHPGFVKTRMVDFGGVLTTEESVAGLTARIAELNLDNSGSFWHCNGEELPW